MERKKKYVQCQEKDRMKDKSSNRVCTICRIKEREINTQRQKENNQNIERKIKKRRRRKTDKERQRLRESFNCYQLQLCRNWQKLMIKNFINFISYKTNLIHLTCQPNIRTCCKCKTAIGKNKNKNKKMILMRNANIL